MDLIALLLTLLTSQGDEGTGIDPWGFRAPTDGDVGARIDDNG